VLGALGLYQPFADWAKAGATVPLLGFGNVLWNGVKEAVDKEGLLGVLTGGLSASSAGISAALLFGLFSSFLFKTKSKRM
jgi:stage V sporulation protein AE